MGAAAYWARSTARRRGGGLLFALLVGLAMAAPAAAVAGIRRADSVIERFRDEYLVANVSLQIGDLTAAEVDAINSMPGVIVAGQRSTAFVTPAGSELRPFLDFYGSGSADGRWAYEVFRPKLDAGRMPAPDQAHEVLATRRLADHLDLEVGDRMTLQSHRPDAVFEFFDTGIMPPVEGPEVDVSVVGVGDLPVDMFATSSFDYGTVMFTPAFIARYGDEIAHFDDVIDVRLAGGDAAIDAFVDDVRTLTQPEGDFSVTPATDDLAAVRDSVDVDRTATLVLAVVATIAGLVVIAEAAVRRAARHEDELATLSAAGMTTRERVMAVVFTTMPVALAGAALAAALAVAASPLFPFGLSGRLEPDRGLDIDGPVVSAAALATIVLTSIAVAAAALVVDRRRRAPRPQRASALLAMVSRWASPAAAVGTRLALHPGRGRTAVPVRSAVLGTAVGLGGALAAFTFGNNLDRLLDTPARYGVPFDVELSITGDESSDAAAIEGSEPLAARDDVGGVSVVRVAKLDVAGRTVDALGIRDLAGGIGYTIISGREPASAGEVVVGAKLLDELGLGIGDTLTVGEGEASARALVVGKAVLPPIDDPDAVADAAGFTLDGLARFHDELGTPDDERGFVTTVVRAAPGVDPEALRASLARDYDFLRTSLRPTSVANLAEVSGVSDIAATLLGLLGSAALAHALLTAVRRRRADLAVLRALGFTRRDVARAVWWQAGTITIVGLVAGLPLAVIGGRWCWILLASGLGVATDALVPLLLFAAIAASAVAVAALIAALPARFASRTPTAMVLRAE